LKSRGEREALFGSLHNTYDTLAPRCYHCGAPHPEVTDEGQSCIYCGWVRYIDKKVLDKLMRKYQDRIVV